MDRVLVSLLVLLQIYANQATTTIPATSSIPTTTTPIDTTTATPIDTTTATPIDTATATPIDTTTATPIDSTTDVNEPTATTLKAATTNTSSSTLSDATSWSSTRSSAGNTISMGSGDAESTSPVTTTSYASTGSTQTTSTSATTSQTTTATTSQTTTATTSQTSTSAARTQATTASTTTTTQPASTLVTTTGVQSTTTSTEPETTTPPGGGPEGILAGVLIFLAIVVIVLIIVLYYYCTSKRPPCFKSRPSDEEEVPLDVVNGNIRPFRASVTHKPRFVVDHMMINQEDFEVEYARKAADDNRLFRMEFQSLANPAIEKTVAQREENRIKNRYDNVLPYDVTRVVLGQDDQSSVGYINANFISGYLKEKKWIACQGPKEETTTDFWQMIWEQKCPVIVMVTRLIEKGKLKCHQYWPQEERSDDGGEECFGKEVYGDYTVTIMSIQERGFYVIRLFKLEYMDEPSRMISQFHYIAWPDFGVPSNASQLLQFRRRVISATPPHSGPTVVHCSAGVGRTGTFIVIDAAIEQLKAEGKTDVYSFLHRIRQQRMMLVQTDAQYGFAHKALMESIKFGNTEVTVNHFKRLAQELRDKADDGEETKLETEFQKLLKIPMAKDCLKHGRKSLKKNRVLQIIPYDFNRVLLPRKPGNDRSDYINASYIDGFRQEKAFIATQGPLPDTVADFWTMVWENRIENIVMLTRLSEKGHSTCHCYWPTSADQAMTCGDQIISFISQDNDDDIVDYTVREFKLTHKQHPDEERKVQQFHYVGWPDIGSGAPKDAQGLIEIIERVRGKSDQSSSPSPGLQPIVVHCSSGGGRTGVFCCLAILMEQAYSEGLVDVFQTVRFLREQRPHMIQTPEQYMFCYTSLLQYIDSNQVTDSETMLSNIPSSSSSETSSVSDDFALTKESLSPAQAAGSINLGSMNNKLLVSPTSSRAESQTNSLAPSYDSPNKDGLPSDGKGAYVPLVDKSDDLKPSKSTSDNSPAHSSGTVEVDIIDEGKEQGEQLVSV